MSDNINTEKPTATAPPSYSTIYPTGVPQPDAPQYGFQPPANQQMYPPSYPPQSYPTGYPPYPQPGYPPQSQPGYPPQSQPGYNTTPKTTQPTAATQQTVIIMGGCPSCRTGVLEDNYTCCGILCAICFFPIGILCCLAMKEKRCTTCNSTF